MAQIHRERGMCCDVAPVGVVVIHQHVLKSTTCVMGLERDGRDMREGRDQKFEVLETSTLRLAALPVLTPRIAFPPDAKVF